MIRIAALDDYQGVALEMADWSALSGRAAVEVLRDHLADPDEVVARLLPFDVACVMRERTPLPRAILERLPGLKLIVSTGRRNASIDLAAAKERGIEIMNTGYDGSSTVELTWALILAGARHLVLESTNLRAGGWQRTVGDNLRGKVLGVLGLGSIGAEVARLGAAFGMDVIAWSQNLTPESAQERGARWVSKESLFRTADVLSIHLVLSDRTRGIVGAAELSLDNVLATPHIGYVSRDLYATFYEDTVAAITRWLDALHS